MCAKRSRKERNLLVTVTYFAWIFFCEIWKKTVLLFFMTREGVTKERPGELRQKINQLK